MQKVFLSFLVLGAVLVGQLLVGQSSVSFPYVMKSPYHKFVQCAAILHNGEVLVDTYSTAGKCRITGNLSGTLSVSTIHFDQENGMKPVAPINFRVAIRNEKSNTLWMYSHDIHKEVNIADILPHLNEGDRIVFLTTNDIYSLPHHEVEILIGC